MRISKPRPRPGRASSRPGSHCVGAKKRAAGAQNERGARVGSVARGRIRRGSGPQEEKGAEENRTASPLHLSLLEVVVLRTIVNRDSTWATAIFHRYKRRFVVSATRKLYAKKLIRIGLGADDWVATPLGRTRDAQERIHLLPTLGHGIFVRVSGYDREKEEA
jgi:hypothetical protein